MPENKGVCLSKFYLVVLVFAHLDDLSYSQSLPLSSCVCRSLGHRRMYQALRNHVNNFNELRCRPRRLTPYRQSAGFSDYLVWHCSLPLFMSDHVNQWRDLGSLLTWRRHASDDLWPCGPVIWALRSFFRSIPLQFATKMVCIGTLYKFHCLGCTLLTIFSVEIFMTFYLKHVAGSFDVPDIYSLFTNDHALKGLVRFIILFPLPLWSSKIWSIIPESVYVLGKGNKVIPSGTEENWVLPWNLSTSSVSDPGNFHKAHSNFYYLYIDESNIPESSKSHGAKLQESTGVTRFLYAGSIKFKKPNSLCTDFVGTNVEPLPV